MGQELLNHSWGGVWLAYDAEHVRTKDVYVRPSPMSVTVSTMIRRRRCPEAQTGHGTPMTTCRQTASIGVVALDGDLPPGVAQDLADHVKDCRACSAYLTQVATTSAVLAMRGNAPEAFSSADEATAGSGDSMRTHQLLLSLATAADPAHAEELVQDTWQHLLEASPDTAPTRMQLSDHLLGHIRTHAKDDDSDMSAWADALAHPHRHKGSDAGGADVPSDASGVTNLRAAADLDRLDIDADRAELFFPDFYDDGPNADSWVSPPTAWPFVTRVLGPDAELQTTELYEVVDAALEQLPSQVGDALHLVDLEGQTPAMVAGLLGIERDVLLSHLSVGRNHLRGRIDEYLAGGR